MGAVSPTLAERAQSGLVRTLAGLPAPLKRALAGAPRTADGQAMDLDTQLLLRLVSLAPDPPKASMSPEAARERMRRATAIVARPPPSVGRVEDLELPGEIGARLYAPRRSAEEGARPLLVYLHGGGWVNGDLDTHDLPCRLLAAEAGVLVLAVDYRRAPEHRFPAALEDGLSAFGWATREADRLGADPDRVAVGGDSAGANLAAVVCRLVRDEGGSAPAMQLLIYPVTDLSVKHPSYRRFSDGFYLTQADMDWYRDHYLPPGHDLTDPRVSPLLADDLSGLPPAYVATAGFDPLRDEGEAYALALRAAGVPTALRRHEGLIHGYGGMVTVMPAARAAMNEAAGALRMGLAAGSTQAAEAR